MSYSPATTATSASAAELTQSPPPPPPPALPPPLLPSLPPPPPPPPQQAASGLLGPAVQAVTAAAPGQRRAALLMCLRAAAADQNTAVLAWLHTFEDFAALAEEEWWNVGGGRRVALAALQRGDAAALQEATRRASGARLHELAADAVSAAPALPAVAYAALHAAGVRVEADDYALLYRAVDANNVTAVRELLAHRRHGGGTTSAAAARRHLHAAVERALQANNVALARVLNVLVVSDEDDGESSEDGSDEDSVPRPTPPTRRRRRHNDATAPAAAAATPPRRSRAGRLYAVPRLHSSPSAENRATQVDAHLRAIYVLDPDSRIAVEEVMGAAQAALQRASLPAEPHHCRAAIERVFHCGDPVRGRLPLRARTAHDEQ